MEDCVITLIYRGDTLKELRKKELHWMHKHKTHDPNGLNEREVYDAFLKQICLPCMYKTKTQENIFTYKVC